MCDTVAQRSQPLPNLPRFRRSRLAPLAGAILAFLPGAALAHGEIQGEPSFSTLFTAWSFDPFVIIGLATIGWVYWMGVQRVNRLHPASPFPRRHITWFYVGLGSMALALLSPLAGYDTTLFSVHMVQHIVITFLAAPLLLVGRPVTLALRAATPKLRKETLIPLLHSRVFRALTYPLLGWVFFALTMWASHFSPLFNHALENVWAHRFEHAWYLSAALLFWWPIVGDVGPWRMSHPLKAVYLFVAMPQNAFVGNAIYSSTSVIYSHYETIGRTWGPSPLGDQEMAGVLMWVVGDLLFLGALCFVAYGWMKHEEFSTKRNDRQLAREREMARAAESQPGQLAID